MIMEGERVSGRWFKREYAANFAEKKRGVKESTAAMGSVRGQKVFIDATNRREAHSWTRTREKKVGERGRENF